MASRSELLEQKLELEKEIADCDKDVYPYSAKLLQDKHLSVLSELAALPPEPSPKESPGPGVPNPPGPGNLPRKDAEIDSFEIGTPGKSGVIKIYYDSSATPKEEVERRIINAANYLTISRGLMKTE